MTTIVSYPLAQNLDDSRADELDGFSAWIVHTMESLGSFGAGLLIFLEAIIPPIPSEIILPLAGFAASQGKLNFFAALFWCTLGSLITAWLYYGLGAKLGERRTRNLLIKLPLLSARDIERTEAWFEKHGEASVFFGRMLPVFRSLISLPAGVKKMPFLRFSLYTTAGSLIWNSILIGAGYLLGEQWHIAETVVGRFSSVVAIVVITIVVIWALRRMFYLWRNRP